VWLSPKIAVVGPGAVGSYYGARLAYAGRIVHFLLRSDFAAVRRHGVTILSPNGNFNARPRTARQPDEIGTCDVVLIALKTTANDQFAKLLPPLVGLQTAIVTLQNGLGNEEALAQLFPVEQILGGLCFVGLNRTAPGVVQHLGEGTILLGEYLRWPEPRTQDLASLFRHAGVPCKVTDQLARARWEKLVWNIAFNGLGVAAAASPETLARSGQLLASALPAHACLTSGELLDHGPREALVRALMLETIAIANALGHAVPTDLADRMIERTRRLGEYKASTILDFELGRPLELDSLFLAPLRQAQKVGVATPHLVALCQVLQGLAAPKVTQGPT